MDDKIILKPQAGPQERFLATPASICIYGGAAGSGKTYAELLVPLRYIDVPGYGAVIFRKNANQIYNEGGLWHEASKMYGTIEGAEVRKGDGAWIFRDRTGKECSRVSFRHI